MAEPNSIPCPVGLEINISHRYKAGEMGVFEFRIRNLISRAIPALDLAVECPCQVTRRKSAAVKNIPPASEKRPHFQFEPARGGEALLEIELIVDDENRFPQVYRGQSSVSISSENEGSKSPTSFNIDIHDIQKLMGNDLSGLLTIAGQELNEDRLRERMERKEPFWMRVDLDLDEYDTQRRRTAKREIIHVPDHRTFRTARALIESVDPSFPKRLFLYSAQEIRFGRNAQKNDAVLRFLPDFYNDERSKTISGEQFVVRYGNGEGYLSLAPQGHASVSWDGRAVERNEKVPLTGGSQLTIGTHEFALRISCVASSNDSHWMRSREEIVGSGSLR